MSLIKTFIEEIEREAVSMEKSLARVPSDKLDWSPHNKSMSLKALATHLAEIGGLPGLVVTRDELDFAQAKPTKEIMNAKDLVELYNRGKQKSIDALKSAKDEDLEENWVMRNGEHIILDLPKKEVIRMIGLNHAYHHRAQLGIYLRLLDVPVPSVYGPSADEPK